MAAGGGGAWKVAYADFVTAMMALFMVLWIMNQDQEVKGSVEEFFKNPWTAALSDSTGIIPVKNADVVSSRKANFEKASAVELEAIKRLNEDLVKTFIQNSEFRENRSLNVEMTPDGVLINFLDNPGQPIFEKDGSEFTPYGAFVFNTVAWAIARYPSTQIELEGHTEEGFKPVRKDYGAWEISLDRASSARRRLLTQGVNNSQIIKVSGFGGTQPLKDRNSFDSSNRRVTVMLRAGKEPF
ncbi:MAG: OmpA family protein [Verrucomicrobia bacterium]|nr:OmpA family protein [Verrucomicrobiota bacterium]